MRWNRFDANDTDKSKAELGVPISEILPNYPEPIPIVPEGGNDPKHAGDPYG